MNPSFYKYDWEVYNMKSFKKILVTILVMFISFGAIESSQIQASASTIPNIKISEKNNGKIENGLEKTQKKQVLNKILTEYRGVVTFISGIGTLSMIMFFIFNFIALGNSKGNPQERQKAIHGLIASGLATAGLGSVTLITGLFYNMLNLK